jgi:hypothetical protein
MGGVNGPDQVVAVQDVPGDHELRLAVVEAPEPHGLAGDVDTLQRQPGVDPKHVEGLGLVPPHGLAEVLIVDVGPRRASWLGAGHAAVALKISG